MFSGFADMNVTFRENKVFAGSSEQISSSI